MRVLREISWQQDKGRSAFSLNWGFQAFLNWIILKFMFSEMGRIIEETFLPILRLLVEDKEKLLKDYNELVTSRTRLPFYASPYQRWLANYGNFVRENEFALQHLKKHLSEEDFNELVVVYTAERLGKRFEFMKNALQKVSKKQDLNELMQSPTGRRMVPIINHLSQFLVGPMDAYIDDTGVLMMEIPECAMHKSVSESEAQELSCLYSCKAACEAVFSKDDAMCFEFEPHLPGFSCTLRVYMDGHQILEQKRSQDSKRIPLSSVA